MSTLQHIIKRQWIEQAERDIRELRRERTIEATQMAALLQEALDECLLEAVSPMLYEEGSRRAQSDDAVMAGAMAFVRSRSLN